MSTNDTLRGLLIDALCGLRVLRTVVTVKQFNLAVEATNELIDRIDAALAEPVAGQAVVLPDERAAFEAWRLANFCGGDERLRKCSNAPDIYYYTAEQEAWRVWQARAALNGGAVAGQFEPEWFTPDQLPDVTEGDDRELIVCVRRKRTGKCYVFSARYLNKYALYSEYDEDADEEGMLISTGWYDVRESAELDNWYSPLLDPESGDELVLWSYLPGVPAKAESGAGDA